MEKKKKIDEILIKFQLNKIELGQLGRLIDEINNCNPAVKQVFVLYTASSLFEVVKKDDENFKELLKGIVADLLK